MFQHKTSAQNWQKVFSGFGAKQTAGCLLVVLLMPINWALEAKKWQLVLRPVQKKNIFDSYKSVLWGATLGNLSPLMAGDFVGRMKGIPNHSKPKAIASLLLSNGMQMFVLVVFGKIGYEILFANTAVAMTAINVVLRHLLSILILLGVIFFSKLEKLISFKSIPYFYLIQLYSKSAILELFSWSFFRHILFTAQFVILLLVFDVNLPIYLLFGLVSVIFLFKTFGAVLGMFGDIASRQLTVGYFFALFSMPIEPALTATTLLWLINIFVPMFIGAFLIFSKKSPHNKKI